MTSVRQEREREFHNLAFADDRRAALRGLYGVARPARTLYEQLLSITPPGSVAIEIGCGMNSASIELAKLGCVVTAIDISDAAISAARQHAVAQGVDVTYRRMDAERLEFASESVDLIFGTGILHHLDLAAVTREIVRVLRPGGRAVFIEPLGHNPLLNLFRRLTPRLRTDDEHPLLQSDLTFLQNALPASQVTHIALIALAGLVLTPLPKHHILISPLHRIDAVLFRIFPRLRKYSWQCVLELVKPSGPMANHNPTLPRTATGRNTT